MFQNYFKTAFRNFTKYSKYTFINILGLAIGFAACMIIFQYVQQELNYDKFHANYKKIYRLQFKGKISDDFFNVALSCAPMGGAMEKEMPEVESAVRVHRTKANAFFQYGDNKFYEDNFLWADSAFFKIFSFGLIRGDQNKVLETPYSIVLTESTAKKYFGNSDPIGKSLKLNGDKNYLVTGICRDVPPNSHIKFDLIASFNTMIEEGDARYFEDWGSLSYRTYILVAKNATAESIESKFPSFMNSHYGDMTPFDIEFNPYLQDIQRIHLHSNLMGELEVNGDISYIYIMTAVGLVILILAAINFANLTTARSVTRMREIGIRKVSGAGKRQLIRQFLTESEILCLAALVFALVISELALPFINRLSGQLISVSGIFKLNSLLIFLIVSGIIGMLAGSYPAFYLSGFQIIPVIKGQIHFSGRKTNLQNLLIIIQFTISGILIICTLVIFQQVKYTKQKNLGFDKDHVILIPIRGKDKKKTYKKIKQEFEKSSFIRNISASSHVMGKSLDGTGYSPEGIDSNSPWILFTNYVDFDYVKTLGITISSGRDFDPKNSTDSSGVLINETLRKKLNWEYPIGKTISEFGREGNDYKVIGVVKDLHFRSLHETIKPLILIPRFSNFNYMNICLSPGNHIKQIKELEKQWNTLDSKFPFDYIFLDDTFKQLYSKEEKTASLLLFFTLLSLLIACLGLYGLASFITAQKTKEIGIRKILGSDISAILLLLSQSFLKKVLFAGILSVPIAYLLINKWLSNFAYHFDLYSNLWWIIILSIFSSMLIALSTIVGNAFKVARANPVDAVKYE